MTESFDLRDAPWIFVETLRGERRELSTREALSQAHTLRAINDESPLVLAALTRHLLAVLHRAYDGPKSQREWATIMKTGRFDAAKIDAYLDSERARGRMDLFDPERPFAQTRGVAEKFAEYAQPIDELDLLRAGWGSGRNLFRHRPEREVPRFTPSRAARALLAHHAFATGGLIRKPGEPTAATASPLVRAGVVLLQRGNLFETLCANLLVYVPSEGRPTPLGAASDACSWETEGLPRTIAANEEQKVRPSGYLGQLTWLGRRVELIREGAMVTRFVNAVGVGLPAESPRDPMVTYRRDEERGYVPIGINVERAFWRSSAALFEAARDENSPWIRPAAFDLVASETARAALAEATVFGVGVHGIDAEKSRVDAVRVERFEVLAMTLDDPDARRVVQSAIRFAEESVKALSWALRTYARSAFAPGGRDVASDDVDGFVRGTGAIERVWSALGVRFESLLRDLDRDVVALIAFEKDVLRDVQQTFSGATSACDGSGGGLKARANAERALREGLPLRTKSPVAVAAQPEDNTEEAR
jgi:CRISPR system Cascade subunit CasA